jgi:hypothetical protein
MKVRYKDPICVLAECASNAAITAVRRAYKYSDEMPPSEGVITAIGIAAEKAFHEMLDDVGIEVLP